MGYQSNMTRFSTIAFLAIVAAGLIAFPVTHAWAENIKGFEAQTLGKQTYTRYPGDKGYYFGTTQRDLNGPEEPYVEKCVWTMEAPIFGGLTQSCTRYTTDSLPQ